MIFFGEQVDELFFCVLVDYVCLQINIDGSLPRVHKHCANAVSETVARTYNESLTRSEEFPRCP